MNAIRQSADRQPRRRRSWPSCLSGLLWMFGLTSIPAAAFAADGASLPGTYFLAPIAAALPAPYFLAPAGAILALLMAIFFYKRVMSHSEGDDNMVRIAQAVRVHGVV